MWGVHASGGECVTKVLGKSYENLLNLSHIKKTYSFHSASLSFPHSPWFRLSPSKFYPRKVFMDCRSWTFTGQMPFLTPNQQCQNTKGIEQHRKTEAQFLSLTVICHTDKLLLTTTFSSRVIGLLSRDHSMLG